MPTREEILARVRERNKINKPDHPGQSHAEYRNSPKRLLELIKAAKGRGGWRWEGGKAVHESGFAVWLDPETKLFNAISNGMGYVMVDNAFKAVENVVKGGGVPSGGG